MKENIIIERLKSLSPKFTLKKDKIVIIKYTKIKSLDI